MEYFLDSLNITIKILEADVSSSVLEVRPLAGTLAGKKYSRTFWNNCRAMHYVCDDYQGHLGAMNRVTWGSNQ